MCANLRNSTMKLLSKSGMCANLRNSTMKLLSKSGMCANLRNSTMKLLSKSGMYANLRNSTMKLLSKSGMCANLWNSTMKLLSKTLAVRYRRSRSMRWWTRFITISITQAWQVIWPFLLQMFLAWYCVRLPLLFEQHRKKKSQAGRSVNGLAKKCRRESRYFLKKSLRRKRGGQPTTDPFFFNHLPSWPYNELTSPCLLRDARVLTKSKWWINPAPLLTKNKDRMDGHAARKSEKRHTYRIFVWKHEIKDHLGVWL